MALIIPTPPTESLEALRGAAEAYPEIRVKIGNYGGGTDTAKSLAHKVYTVGLTDLVSGNFVARVRLVGWRYIVRNQGATSFSAEVDILQTGEHQFSQLNEGPFVEQTAELIERFKESEAVRNGTYELAVLKIPAIYVMALWLRSSNGRDIVIPMSPTLETLEAGREYDIDEISPILAEAAAERLRFDDSPRV